MQKPLHLRIYRKVFFNFMIFNPVLIIVAFFLREAGLRTNKYLESVKASNYFFSAILILFLLVAIIFKFSRSKFRMIRDEEAKLIAYRQFFVMKMWVYLCLSLIISLVYVLSGNYFFLYFAIFEFLLFLLDFPFKARVKRDLGDENIFFV